MPVEKLKVVPYEKDTAKSFCLVCGEPTEHRIIGFWEGSKRCIGMCEKCGNFKTIEDLVWKFRRVWKVVGG